MQAQFHNLITLALIAVIVSGIIAVPIINLLYKFKVVRKIEVDFSTLIADRKLKYGTPIMGGLIFIMTIVSVNFFFNFNIFTTIPILLFAITALLGAADDLLNIFGQARKFKSIDRVITLIRVHKSFWVRLRYILLFPWYLFVGIMHAFESNPGSGLRAHEKLLIQGMIGAILGIWYLKLFGGIFWVPFVGTYDIGAWIIPFAAITYMGTVNSVNVTDGMDGLSGGLGVISLFSFTAIAFLTNFYSSALFAAIGLGSMITYLYFNIKPARVQMGDAGSFALGGLLTTLAFLIGKPIILIFIGLPYLIEMLSTIVQAISRRVFGRRILQMAPLHHHFEMIGWTEDKVVVRFWLFSLVCNLIALWISFY